MIQNRVPTQLITLQTNHQKTTFSYKPTTTPGPWWIRLHLRRAYCAQSLPRRLPSCRAAACPVAAPPPAQVSGFGRAAPPAQRNALACHVVEEVASLLPIKSKVKKGVVNLVKALSGQQVAAEDFLKAAGLKDKAARQGVAAAMQAGAARDSDEPKPVRHLVADRTRVEIVRI